MTTAGSGVSNLTIIRATTPYALAAGALSAAALLRSNISACFLTVCYGCIPFL